MSQKLKELFDREYQWLLKDNPEFASQAGVNELDGELQDVSYDSFENRKEHARNFLKEMDEIKTSEAAILSIQEKIYLNMVVYMYLFKVSI